MTCLLRSWFSGGLLVAMLAVASCRPVLRGIDVPTRVRPGHTFTVSVQGIEPNASLGMFGSVGCVVQLPVGVAIQGFCTEPESQPSSPYVVTRDRPALLGLYVPESGHYLASFDTTTGYPFGYLHLFLQAPLGAPGPMTIKVALAGDQPALWTPSDPVGVTNFAAIGGAYAGTFALSPDPDVFEWSADGLPHTFGAVAAGDFDGDGNDDLVAIDQLPPAVLRVALSRPGASWTMVATPIAYYPPFPTVPVVADFDRDGFADVALPGQVWFGDGHGSFVAGPVLPYAFPAGSLLPLVTTGDVDGDTIPDIAFVGTTGTQVFRSNGDRTFTEWSTGLPGQIVQPPICLHDMNQDGYADLVIANATFPQPRVDIYLSDGHGSWSLGAQVPFSTYPNEIQVGDLTNDGLDDIVIGINNSRAFDVLAGTGNLHYVPASIPPIPAVNGGFALVDFDRDGVLDLVGVAAPVSGMPRTTLLRNLGNGSFAVVADAGLVCAGHAVTIGDFDGDTFPDLAAGFPWVWTNMTTGLSRFGEGCAAGGAAPNIVGNGAPQRGNAAFAVNCAGGLPSGPAAIWFGFSRRFAFGAAVLPLDLAPFGASGCSLWSAPDSVLLVLGDPSGHSSAPLAIPNDTSLRFATVFAQGAVIAPAANPLGVRFSAGLAIRVQ